MILDLTGEALGRMAALHSDELDEAPTKILSSPRGGEVRVYRRAYAAARFGVRFSESIQGFNGDDCDSGTLVLKGTCTKTSRLAL